MAELIVRREGAVGWVLLSNPAKHNAVTYEMLRALPEAVARHDRDGHVRVIALAGDGGEDFASGADIKEYAAIRGSHYAASSYGQMLDGVYQAFAALRKPTVAKVRGACIGIGLSLAVCCDVRMTTTGARISHPATRFGMGISWGGMQRLVALIGPADTADLVFSGRSITGKRAYKIGFASRVVPDADIDRQFAELCASIANGAPLTIAAAKRAIAEALRDPDKRNLKELQAMIDACNASDDYKEGLAAYGAKRAPLFKGR
jgi:enoyl-CoA hydratase/carnithine racemase